MNKKEERKFKVNFNNKKCLVIEDEENWIKIIPLDFPSSGTMFSYTDNLKHHWDFYDKNGQKQKELTVYFDGYSLKRMYVCAGQNAFKIEPGTDIKVIPYEGINKLTTTKCMDKYIVSSNADGCLMFVIKKPC